MKTSIAVTLVLVGLFPSTGFPEESPGRREVPVEPQFARFGHRYSSTTLNLWGDYFQGLSIQEASGFEGYKFGLEIAQPIFKKFQLRIVLPLYTRGEAKSTVAPLDLDIEGNGGIFEFPGGLIEYQFLREERTGLNAMVALGYGWVVDPLEATVNGVLIDNFNHQGKKFTGLFKVDQTTLAGDLTWIGNLRLDGFAQSDDLNPGGDKDKFVLGTLSGAAIWNGLSSHFYPALELLFTTEFENYHALTVAPELLIRTWRFLDVKLGVQAGLTSDAPDFGARVGLTFRL